MKKTDRNEKLLQILILCDMTYEEVGAMFGVRKSRVYAIKKANQELVKDLLITHQKEKQARIDTVNNY